MDIWDWVHTAYYELIDSGNQRLADAMDDLPSLACGDHHEKLDLIYPEALSLAKKWKNPWVEVFIRHWHLQSQILHRHNVKGMLAEAIDLLEFSSREETKNCPQSICVVQDLANCYAKKDGPAYIQERINVSTETLSRIDPKWPCYDCIASEEVSAIIDGKQYQQALLRIEQHREALAKVSVSGQKIPFALAEIRICVETGQYQRAESIARKAENPAAGESFVRYKNAAIALALAFQGKFEESLDFEVPYSEVIVAQSHYLSWSELNFLKAKHNQSLNSDDLNYCFNRIVGNYLKHGVQRDTLTVLQWQVELAFDRHDLFTVEQCLNKAQLIIQELVKDLGASEIFAGLSKQLNQRLNDSSAGLDLSLESVLASINHHKIDLSYLKLAYEKNPDNEQIITAYFDLLVENGYLDESISVAKNYIRTVKPYGPLLSRLGNLLLDEKQLEQFDEFFNLDFIESMPVKNKVYAYFVLSNRYENTEPEKSLKFIKLVIEENPQLEIALRRAASLSITLHQWQDSIGFWDRLISLDEENSHYHWDKMVASTLAEDWGKVRESCKALEIEVNQGQGPIDVDMGSCRIQLVDENDNTIILAAKRVGPVEAEITAIRGLEDQQFFGDRFVFDAAPLNQLDQQDEEGYLCDSEGQYTYLYKAIKLKQKDPHFYFAIDGVFPGDENWQKLTEIFCQFDAAWSNRSTDEYQVQVGGAGEMLDAVYLFVACPLKADLFELNRLMCELNESFEHPMIWPLLASELGDEKLLQMQSEAEALYELY